MSYSSLLISTLLRGVWAFTSIRQWLYFRRVKTNICKSWWFYFQCLWFNLLIKQIKAIVIYYIHCNYITQLQSKESVTRWSEVTEMEVERTIYLFMYSPGAVLESRGGLGGSLVITSGHVASYISICHLIIMMWLTAMSINFKNGEKQVWLFTERYLWNKDNLWVILWNLWKRNTMQTKLKNVEQIKRLCLIL